MGKKKRAKNKKIILISLMAVLAVVFITGTILANHFSVSVDWVLGRGERHVVNIENVNQADTEYYTNKYNSPEESRLASAKLASKVGEEGEVLLKNNGDILPLARNSKVTPFGYRYITPIYGGAGSANIDTTVDYVVTAEEALNTYFSVNSAVVDVMKRANVEILSGESVSPGGGYSGSDQRIYEFNPTIYFGAETTYADTTAIVFIGRAGGEGSDLYTRTYDDGTRHSLALTQNEKATLDLAKSRCSNVVVIVNSSNIMELKELRDDDGIDAILWVGSPGAMGFEAMARILCGEVNPSGKTVDIWYADFMADPTYTNFGATEYSNVTINQKYYVEYEEGVYLGYRYYETRDMVDPSFNYENDVVYPFGFGLNFEDAKTTQTLTSVGYNNNTITINGEIRNASSRDVKEVVQIYFGAPYHSDSKIEKPAKVLVAYDKISVGAGQTVSFTIAFPVENMAAYDYRGYYTKGTGSYVLEAGNYSIYLAKDSHNEWDSREITIQETLVYDESAVNADAVKKRATDEFAAVNLFNNIRDYIDTTDMTVMSRDNFASSMPSTPYVKDAPSQALVDLVPYDYKTDKETGDVPGSVIYHSEAPVSNMGNGIMLSSLRGLEYDDPLWDDLLNNIDYSSEDIPPLFTYGLYNTGKLDSIGKPGTKDHDGPIGLTAAWGGTVGTMTACAWVSTPIMAATWNQDLAREIGEAIGQESLNNDVNGWYAPGLNLHRSPFGGRNFEYFSEDPLITGKTAASIVSGVATGGLYAYIKHFALNDQDTQRGNISVWADEQTMRELYLKAFEICVKEAVYDLNFFDGNTNSIQTVQRKATTALMTAMSSIGTKFAGCNYELLTSLLRNEWGFRGFVITDMGGALPNKSYDEGFRVGNDVWMTFSAGEIHLESPTAQWAARNTIHNIAYTVVNSNVFNNTAPGASVYYDISPWKIWLYTADALLGLLIICGMIWIIMSGKKAKS
jgi:beta-glucosidase